MNRRNDLSRRSSEYSNNNDDESSQVIKKKEVTAAQKKEAKGKIYKMLYSNWMAWIASLFSLVLGTTPMLMFTVFGNLIGAFSKNEGIMDEVEKCVIYMIIIAAVTALLRFFDALLWIRLGSILSVRIRKQLFTSMMKADVIFFDITPIGSVLTMLSEDSQMVQDAFGTMKGMQIQNIAQFLSGIILTFINSWEIGLIFLATVPLSVISMMMWSPGIIRDTTKKFIHTSASMTIAEEVLSSVRTVRGFNKEQDEINRFLKETKESAVYESHVGMRVTGMVMIVMIFVWGGVVGSLYYGGTLVNKGIEKGDTSFNVGNLFSIFGFMMFGSMGLMTMTGTMQGEQKAVSAGARIFEISDYQPSIPYEGGRTIDNFKGNIKFVNVTFQYPTRPVNVLNNVSFEIKSGQTGALVGHSGSGKSTCVQLLERYYDVQEGVILLDEVDIKEIDPRWLHNQISIVAQEPLLFQTSIRNNITYGLKDITDEQVIEAARASNALKFIEKLPNKFQEQVGEKGSTLSGGQRQRIAIARAVVRKPVVMITDEATSALDAGSEKKVQVALDNILKDLTGVVVAHRLSTIKNADIIYVFDAGHIVEQGKHQELVDKGGAYYNLVKRQLTQEDAAPKKEQTKVAEETKPEKESKKKSDDSSDDESSLSSVSEISGSVSNIEVSSSSSKSSKSSKSSSSSSSSSSKGKEEI